MQQTKELPACPVETTLMLIGDKWKVLILRDLMPGTKRFGELKKSIGSVSQQSICGSSATGGVQPDRPGEKPETHSGRHADMGGEL